MKRKFKTKESNIGEDKTRKTYISSPSRTAEILKRSDIMLRKTYGQNFLIDTNVLKKIANFSCLKDDDVVLEVGSGIGSLTEIMLPKVKRIICIEVDRAISEVFEEIFKEDLGKKIIFLNDDAMKIDYEDFCRIYEINKCVSNLPYKIAAPLMLKILSETDKVKDFYITIQKDIAERIIAKPGDKNYNAFTVKLNYYSRFIKNFPISEKCFYPKPFVGSTTIHLERKDDFLAQVVSDKSQYSDKSQGNENSRYNMILADILKDDSGLTDFTDSFFKFVEDCFSHRRKKLINSLILSGENYEKNQENILLNLKKVGFNKDSRAEELSLKDYLVLFINLMSYKFFAVS